MAKEKILIVDDEEDEEDEEDDLEEEPWQEVEDDDEPADQRLDEIKQQIRRGDYLNNDIVTGLADRLADTWSDGLE